MTPRAQHLPREVLQAAGVNGHQPGTVGTRLDPAELLELGREPIPWVLDRFAARGFLTLLASRGGEGKSLFTLAAGAAVQAGGSVGGIPATAGSAAVWDAENGPPLLGRRLLLLGPHAPFPALYDAAPVRLTDPATIAALAAEITAEGYELVVLDALRTLAPQVKESDGDELAPLIVAVKNLARETGAAVVLIAHRDKSLIHDYRGSSVQHDQADLVFVLERDPKDPLARWRRRLRCSKARICEEPDDRWLGLRIHRGELTITRAEPYDPDTRGPAVRDDLAAELLAELRDAGHERLSRSELARRVGRHRDDSSVRRALDDLEAQGAVTRDDEAGGWGGSPPSDPPTSPPNRSPRVTGGGTPVGGPPGDPPDPPSRVTPPDPATSPPSQTSP